MTRLLATVLIGLALAACGAGPDTRLAPEPTPSYAPLRHPFHNARLFQSSGSSAAKWYSAHGRPAWLAPIVSTPQAIWLNSPQDLAPLPALARQARAQKTLLVLVAYYIPDRGCTERRDGAPSDEAYLAWIDQMISALGSTSAVIIMEPDAIAADCFSPARARLLTQTVQKLSAAKHFVYLDAGHPKWKTPGEAAERLIASGIQNAEGFAVNISNRQTTQDSQRWGLEVSDLTGNRDFVIDTSRNGIGPPPDDPNRDDEWCNPAHQGLGERPTTDTRLDRTAALLWIKRPGESDGHCGGEATYEFAPRQARNLIVNAEPWLPAQLRTQAQKAPLG